MQAIIHVHPLITAKRSLQLRLRPLIQQVRHLKPRPIRVQAGCWSLTIPRPLLLELRREIVLEHLDNVLAKHGEKLVAVEGAACCDIQTLCTGVWRNDEVG